MREPAQPAESAPHSDPTPRVAAVILAAGRGRRMGGPKALCRQWPEGPAWDGVRGRTWLAHLARLAREAGLAPVVAVLEAGRPEVWREARRLEAQGLLHPVANDQIERGMLHSLQIGLGWLSGQSGLAGALLWPVDHPLVEPQTLSTLRDGLLGSCGGWIQPRVGGRAGHPVAISVDLFPMLMVTPEDRLDRALEQMAGMTSVDLDDIGITVNVNTPGVLSHLPVAVPLGGMKRPADPNQGLL